MGEDEEGLYCNKCGLAPYFCKCELTPEELGTINEGARIQNRAEELQRLGVVGTRTDELLTPEEIIDKCFDYFFGIVASDKVIVNLLDQLQIVRENFKAQLAKSKLAKEVCPKCGGDGLKWVGSHPYEFTNGLCPTCQAKSQEERR